MTTTPEPLSGEEEKGQRAAMVDDRCALNKYWTDRLFATLDLARRERDEAVAGLSALADSANAVCAAVNAVRSDLGTQFPALSEAVLRLSMAVVATPATALAEVRARAFEEAAKLCESKAAKLRTDADEFPTGAAEQAADMDCAAIGANDCAKLLRAAASEGADR